MPKIEERGLSSPFLLSPPFCPVFDRLFFGPLVGLSPRAGGAAGGLQMSPPCLATATASAITPPPLPHHHFNVRTPGLPSAAFIGN